MPDIQVDFLAIITAVVINFFLAYVLAYTLAAWSPETWDSALAGQTPVTLSLCTAFFIWLGFMVPVLINSVTWEQKSWKLFSINGTYYFFILFIAALVLTHF